MTAAEMAIAGTACSGSEEALIEACRHGDPHAFARLVEQHEGLVFNLATRLLRDPEEARDCAQEVFLQVHRMLPRFAGRSSLKTWIYRIVVNQCYNRQRWWRRRRKDRSCAIEEMTPAEEFKRSAETQDGPFEQCRRREQAEQVQMALKKLSFDHRSILLLREVEGLSCEEIAETLDLPEGTVKSRLSRAREALRLSLLPMLGAGEKP